MIFNLRGVLISQTPIFECMNKGRCLLSEHHMKASMLHVARQKDLSPFLEACGAFIWVQEPRNMILNNAGKRPC